MVQAVRKSQTKLISSALLGLFILPLGTKTMLTFDIFIRKKKKF